MLQYELVTLKTAYRRAERVPELARILGQIFDFGIFSNRTIVMCVYGVLKKLACGRKVSMGARVWVLERVLTGLLNGPCAWEVAIWSRCLICGFMQTARACTRLLTCAFPQKRVFFLLQTGPLACKGGPFLIKYQKITLHDQSMYRGCILLSSAP